MEASMKQHSITVTLCILLCFGASLASAGPKYTVTLESGATYAIERVDAQTYNVENSSGAVIGHLKIGEPGEGVDVFDAQDTLLGSADRLNPDALDILEANQ